MSEISVGGGAPAAMGRTSGGFSLWWERNDMWAFGYLLPCILVLGVFHLLPIFYSLALSLFHQSPSRLFREFAGLTHYSDLIRDPQFWNSLLNTLWFVLGSVPLSIAGALLVALALNSGLRGMGIYRTIYFLPVVTSAAAISLVWKWVYHPKRGVLNEMLSWMGLSPVDWLNETQGMFQLLAGGVGLTLPEWLQGPSVPMVAIVIMNVWQRLGYNVIIFLAGLQNIPKELYEAAEIDGAGPWRSFWNVTWPLLSPTTYFILIMSTIGSFQVFAQIFVMYSGNATDSARVIVYYLYEKGFQTFELGYASSIAYILLFVIMTLTLLQKRYVGRRVHYG